MTAPTCAEKTDHATNAKVEQGPMIRSGVDLQSERK